MSTDNDAHPWVINISILFVPPCPSLLTLMSIYMYVCMAHRCAFYASMACLPEHMDRACVFWRQSSLVRHWRHWKAFRRMYRQRVRATDHFLSRLKQRVFRLWHVHTQMAQKLRHAWIYWESSALWLRFHQWHTVLVFQKTIRTQTAILEARQARRYLLRWTRWYHTRCRQNQLSQEAAAVFMVSSLGDCFRRWRMFFDSKIQKQTRLRSALSTVLCTSLRGFFERWRQGISCQQAHAHALLLADSHYGQHGLLNSIQRWHGHAKEMHRIRSMWSRVVQFHIRHCTRRFFDSWLHFLASVQHHRQCKQIAIQVCRRYRMQRPFQRWVALVLYKQALLDRVRAHRHMYFSSLHARILLHLRAFAVLKRRLRRLIDQQRQRRCHNTFLRYERLSSVSRFDLSIHLYIYIYI
jgi:hypothetical protein